MTKSKNKTKVTFWAESHLYGHCADSIVMFLGPRQLKKKLQELNSYIASDMVTSTLYYKSFPGQNQHGEECMEYGMTYYVKIEK